MLSGYPALAETLSAIGLQSDTIPVKPIEIVSLREPFLRKAHLLRTSSFVASKWRGSPFWSMISMLPFSIG